MSKQPNISQVHNKYQHNMKMTIKYVLMDYTRRHVNHDGKLMKGYQGFDYDRPYIGGEQVRLGVDGPCD
jgi:hypothetical protein